MARLQRRTVRDAAEGRTKSAPMRTGRMPCPDCGAAIVLPIESMFTGRPIPCTACGITIAVDLSQSGPALQALRKAEAIVESMRSMSRRHG